MKMSVVVPTCNRNDLLALCLDRLRPEQQRFPAGQYEVIVTDNSTGVTAGAMVRQKFPWAKWVRGPGGGPSANRNCGARAAAGRWLVFTDDDCLPGPSFISSFAEAIAGHPESLVFEGRTLPMGERRHPLEDAPINLSGGLLWACNLAIQKDLYWKIGGFDERFLYGGMEDVELRLRLAKAGINPVFVSAAEVTHPWRLVKLKPHTRLHVAAQKTLLAIHPEQRRRFALLQHCRNIARYYAKAFPMELKAFGWLAIRCQPVRWWAMFYRAWHYAGMRSAVPSSNALSSQHNPR